MSMRFNEYQPAKCLVADCDHPRVLHGYCKMHHARILRHGDVNTVNRDNGHTKPPLTDDEIREIKQMHRNLMSAAVIGKRFNRHALTIKRVLDGTYGRKTA